MVSTKLCPSCGQEIDTHDLFCKFCGLKNEPISENTEQLGAEYQCPACGKSILRSDKYCVYCGSCLGITPIVYDEDERHCQACGKRILASDKYCIYCGTPVIGVAPIVTPIFVEEPEKEVRNRKKTGLLIVAIVLLIVVGVIGFIQFIKPLLDYNSAEKHLANSEYQEAITLYEQLGEYKDSKDKIIEAKYQRAGVYLDSQQYEDAITEYELLGDYKESPQKLNESKYLFANHLFSDSSYNEAITFYEELGEYKDAPEKVQQIKYIIAQKYFNEHHYDEAKMLFDEIAEYSDAATMLKECMYQIGLQYIEMGDYNRSNEMFIALGDYKDSLELIHVHEYTETIITSATCTSDGHASYKCIVCGDSYEADIPMYGHNWIAATCTTAQYCSNCGEVVGSALGHTTSTGVCERCGYNFTPPFTISDSFSTTYNTVDYVFTTSKEYSCYLPPGSYRVDLTFSTPTQGKVTVSLLDSDYSAGGHGPYGDFPATLYASGMASTRHSFTNETRILKVHISGEGSYTITVSPIN